MDASRRNVTSFLENLDPRLQGFNSFRFIQRFLQRRPQGDSTSEAVIRIVDNIRPTNGFADYLLTVDMSRFVSRDVALRHRVEDAQNLVNASAFPAIMTVVTGRLHAYNSALVEVSRFSREDLDDPEFAPLELLDDESLPHYLKTSIALRENPKLSTSSFRARLRRKDGRRIEYCAGVTYVRDTGSKLVCSVIVFTPMPE
jgi:PAS domain-containing protein